MADQQWYPAGSRPRVLINWNSFVTEGIPNDWQGPFAEAVMNAYTRWQNIAGHRYAHPCAKTVPLS